MTDRLRCLAVFLLVGSVAAGTSVSSADSVDLGPARDNTIYDGFTGNSNALGENFFAGDDGALRSKRALLYFDVAGSTIPAGATIDSVTLTLNMNKTHFSSGAHSVGLHELSSDWGVALSNAGASGDGAGTAATPGDATWINAFHSSTPWSTAGGDFDSSASATQTVNANGFYTWGSTSGMVADVQGWLDSPSSNFGWLVMGNEGTSQSSKRFASREHPTTTNRPVLAVEFTPIPEPSSFMLLLGSSLMLAGRRRRR